MEIKARVKCRFCDSYFYYWCHPTLKEQDYSDIFGQKMVTELHIPGPEGHELSDLGWEYDLNKNYEIGNVYCPNCVERTGALRK